VELAVQDPRVGVVVGQRYEILARISRGGMATVYRALDVRLDREVALKVMHPHLAESPRFLTRFQAEARAAARLAHPAIVSVADQGVDGEIVWLAMELLPGETVRDQLNQRGAFTLGEAANVMECLLAGLGAAHDAGIIHRDIKPENILATLARPDGPQAAYKVSDFGLARALSGVGSLTESVLGTPAYIAPELARDGQVDARVDLYSAGIVFFELLTGRQPFTADSAVQVILAHINTDVPPVSRAVGRAFGEQSDEIDSLVAWACERDPQLRPANAADFLGELRRVFAAFSREAMTRSAAGSPESGATAAEPTSRWFDTIGAIPLPTAGAQPTVDLGRQEIAATRTATERAADLLEFGALHPVDPGPAQPERMVVSSQLAAGPAAGTAYDSDELDRTALTNPPIGDDGNEYDNGVYGDSRRAGPSDAAYDATRLLSRQRRSPAGPRKFKVRPDATRRRMEQGLGIALLLAMIGALVTAGVIWWTQVGPGAYTTTPAVLNLAPAAAEGVLREAGLDMAIEEVYDDTAPEGTIVASDPGPGEQVREDGTVTVQVSQGPQEVGVPEVVGQPLEAATAALAGAGLPAPRPVDAFDDSVAVGTVISSDPPPGTMVARDQVVALTVSKGPEPREIPLLVGQSRESAEATLAALDLGLGTVSEQYDAAIAAGVVISQEPRSGTLLPGGTVSVVVSLGAEPIAVLDVGNLTSAEARTALENQGFAVEQNGTIFLDRVWQQSPEAGALVPPGSTVTITTF